MASDSAIAVKQTTYFLATTLVGAGLVLASTCLSATSHAADAGRREADSVFGFESVCKVAEARLPIPFSRKVLDLPCELVGLDYDSWRYIAYEGSNTVWRKGDLPFQVETGHRGYLFTQRVDLNEVERGVAADMPFNPHAFEYRDWLKGYRFPRTLGHSGWKLLGKFNDERQAAARNEKDVYVREIGSFLGSSYFRLLGSQHVYGSSTRGLAVDCAMPHPEEFPVFTQYWLERPDVDSTTFRCWALLESERVIGAYQFDITPGLETMVDVKSKLYVRGKIDKLGIAPITSMWMWGGGVKPPTADKRPEVHDADGLLVIGSDDSHLWRPLSRPSVPIVNHYAVPGLKGFGLIQRNRNPKNYADNEALYHRRPSIFIEPKPAWPAGGVELLRLPASHEGIDNIGAFYLLHDPPQVGESIELDYRIHVCDDDKLEVASNTLTGNGLRRKARFLKSDVTNPEPGLWRFHLIAEAKGNALQGRVNEPLSADWISMWNEKGQVSSKSVSVDSNGVKVALEIRTEPGEAFELLLRLHDTTQDLTEMWSYRCEP